MSITEPLPPHAGHMWPTQAVSFTTFTLDDVRSLEAHATAAVSKVQTEADEKIRALEVTAARLAEDLAEARQAGREQQRRANLAEAAGIEAVNAIADGIRREEALQAELGQADTENAAQQRVNMALQDRLDEAVWQERALRDKNALLVADNERLRTENAALADAKTGGRHRFRRH